ncbi:MAG: flagellar hook protein FlgE [Nitrosomonas sp.]|nr:MAG: flagellar hook protein FlgE [Nitrosomonas sp.]HMV11324.1 flagellar hook protein FlgE [Nitrosomonas sp.]HMW20128.1 flagellar hook protein FlgE [Nitrosomonas sp.]HMW68198.1 flagellar hook protein FlgE [Nitrosomonas sp.]HMY60553.1 flagellar hook protein FlgE [Nitrosomonas sp.]
MGFQHGLSGLRAASTNLDVIGNNVANANVIGFKQSQAQFSDIFANSLGGAGSNQVGIGTQVNTIAQSFSQGNISNSTNPLDMAIVGGGFFRLSDNGAISFSRNGQFHLDKSGFLVNADNLNVTGYPADKNGKIIVSGPTNLQLSTAEMTPQATTTFETGVNLDSRTLVPATLPAFDATDPDTYARSTSGTIFDSLGNSHVFTLFFQKSAPSTWDVYATVDGAVDASGVPVGVQLDGGSPLTLTFDSNGVMTGPTGSVTASVDLSAVATNLGIADWGATTPLDFDFDITSSTQFGSNFAVNKLSQDGFTSGRLAGYGISDDGTIQGNYTNGENRTLGQLVLASFANPNGLKPQGNNQWVETAASGLPLIGVPLTGTLGEIQSAAVEEANVDLTTELVNLITAQRVYQANAKTIETQDAVLQTLVNL